MTADASEIRRASRTRTVELEKMIQLERRVVCSNPHCGKACHRVLVLTDFSKAPSGTYYACPYCFSRIRIVAEEECQHFFGYLKRLSDDAAIPNECLTCEKAEQCRFNYRMS